MQPAFWHQRWRENRIGFHQREINLHLEEHWARLGLRADARVLVPLCGKSRDMLYLAQLGHQVVGVELSELAVRAFFEENQLKAEIRQAEGFDIWACGEIQLWCGDFLALGSSALGTVAGVYDRASLVALPAAMRPAYAHQLAALLPGGAAVLLISLEYPPSAMQGPPFAVFSDEVERLLGSRFTIEQRLSIDVLNENPAFAQRGVNELRETVYVLRRRGGAK